MRGSRRGTHQPAVCSRAGARCHHFSGGRIAAGAIEDIAQGVVMAQEAFDSRGQTSASDAGFVVGNPVPNLELQQVAPAVRQIVRHLTAPLSPPESYSAAPNA